MDRKRRPNKYLSAVLITIMCYAALKAFLLPPQVKSIEPAAAVQTDGLFEVYYLDVGQGDSTIIICDGETMLIDAGERGASEYILKMLSELDIDKLDYIVATHPHSDHIGGLPAVIEKMDIDTVIMPDVTHTTKTFENLLDTLESESLEITVAQKGDEFLLGGALLTVLSPYDMEYDNLNNYSVVIKADYGSTSFLFMGDAEKEVEHMLVSDGAILESDVIKLGHHGSSTSSTEDFIYEVMPEYAVISCALDNSYGHPHREVMQMLEQMSINAFITYETGTIYAVSDGDEVSIAPLQSDKH